MICSPRSRAKANHLKSGFILKKSSENDFYISPLGEKIYEKLSCIYET